MNNVVFPFQNFRCREVFKIGLERLVGVGSLRQKLRDYRLLQALTNFDFGLYFCQEDSGHHLIDIVV